MKKLLLALLFFVLSPTGVFALERPVFATIVNTVETTTDPLIDPLTIPRQILTVATASATPISWQFSQSALNDKKLTSYFSQIVSDYPSQTIGARLDNPSLLATSPQNRRQLIDAYFSHFQSIFGRTPDTIDGCGLDANSLSYLHDHYSLVVATTCNPYALGPYIPSKYNSLQPAHDRTNRLGILLVPAPTSSALQLLSQVNEINEFDQITMGLGNLVTNLELVNFLKTLRHLQSTPTKIISFQQLSEYVLNRYPESSPFWFRQYSNTAGLVTKYQNANYQTTLLSQENKTVIDSLYVYPLKLYEAGYSVALPADQQQPWLPSVINTSNPREVYAGSLQGLNPQVSNWQVSLTSNTGGVVFTPLGINDLDVRPFQTIPFDFSRHFRLGVIILLLIIFKFLLAKDYSLCFSFVPAILALVTVLGSGQLTPVGLGFWGPNGHDAIFHLSLIRHFAHNPFSFSHPQLVDTTLSNYHFLFDYLLGLISRISTLDPIPLYFIYAPIAIALLLLFLLKQLLKVLHLPSQTLFFVSAFVFMGGSLGFLYSIFSAGHPWSGESIFWANQSVSLFLNPPLALSFVGLLGFVLALASHAPFWLLVLLGGLLAQTKIYAFVLLVSGLLLSRRIRLGLSVGFVGLVLLVPFLKLGSGSPFIFEPFWFVRSMFASHDRLSWPWLASIYQNYLQSENLWRSFLITLFGFVIFILGNFGFRLVAMRSRLHSSINSLLLWIVFLGLLLPTLFTQTANPWNTIQFLYYSLFIAGIFAGIYLSTLASRGFTSSILALFLLLLGTLTSVGTLRDYLTNLPSSRVSYQELYGLNSLQLSYKKMILSPAYTDRLSRDLPWPRPMYGYTSTAYLSALLPLSEYLSDTINLQITKLPYELKEVQQWRFYQTTDSAWQKQFLVTNQINFVLETPLQHLKTKDSACLNPSFVSPEITINTVTCL